MSHGDNVGGVDVATNRDGRAVVVAIINLRKRIFEFIFGSWQICSAGVQGMSESL